MNKKTIFGIVALVLIGAIAFYLFNNQYKPDSELTELRVGYLPIASGLPLFVAQEEGYFKENGFDVKMERFASSNAVTNAATTNQIDVFIAASNVVFDVGFVSKKKHKLIYTNPYSKDKGHIADYLLVRDITQISKLADLKGKKIGIFPGSVVKVFAKQILAKYGLNETDYTLIELEPKDWIPALETDQIQALSAVEPLASQIMKDNIGYNIMSGFFAELTPNVPLSSQWISEDYILKHDKESVDKIISAMDKAVQFITDNPTEAKKYLMQYANLREDITDDVQLNPWTKHSEINETEIQNFINILFDDGGIQSKENIKDYLLN